jgi:predicted O-methyltransferase YrrM
MLKRLANPNYKAMKSPSRDAVVLLNRVLRTNPNPEIAEIGVAIGATTYALCQALNRAGRIHLFDFGPTLDALAAELREENFDNIVLHPNGRKLFESYNWNLAIMLRQMRNDGKDGIFDLVYLDGAHVFHHDAPAAVVLKELLRPGGYLLFDDYSWTLASSPTLGPSVNASTAENYSQEQIEIAHIALICEIFFDRDTRFERVDLGYPREQGGQELRRAYRKLG